MVKRWLLYLVALLGCLIFFAAHRGWISWILLLMVVLLPGLSLVLSLPLMLLSRAQVSCPSAVTVGEDAALVLLLSSPLPLAPSACTLQVSHSITGQQLFLQSGALLPTDHCGRLTCSSRGIYFYDLLGMFRIHRKLPTLTVLIRPKPIPTEPPRDLERHLAHSWQPKYGGGFAENHELRLYRPGDGLNQVHWKLSAKTGKLIIREPMVPKYGKILLTTDLYGNPYQLDRRMGRLLWMGEHLLKLGLQYELHVLTGSGIQTYPVTTAPELTAALDALLRSTPATGGSIRSRQTAASWQLYIGGDVYA